MGSGEKQLVGMNAKLTINRSSTDGSPVVCGGPIFCSAIRTRLHIIRSLQAVWREATRRVSS